MDEEGEGDSFSFSVCSICSSFTTCEDIPSPPGTSDVTPPSPGTVGTPRGTAHPTRLGTPACPPINAGDTELSPGRRTLRSRPVTEGTGVPPALGTLKCPQNQHHQCP